MASRSAASSMTACAFSSDTRGVLRVIRAAREGDLHELLELYLDLHEDTVPEDSEYLSETWERMLGDPYHHVIVNEMGGEIASSCICVIIPNLTRGVRPYALVENVVTRADLRGSGYASACLARARELALEAGCYKMMLLTGAKDGRTLRFYESAGFNREDKTAFIQWL